MDEESGVDPTRSVSSEPGPSSVPRTEQNTTTRPDPVESCTERLTGVGVGVRPSRGNGVTSEMALIVDGGTRRTDMWFQGCGACMSVGANPSAVLHSNRFFMDESSH